MTRSDKVRFERVPKPGERKKHEESLFGFTVIRDWLGPGSSINMAHGIKKRDPSRMVIALTFEDFVFHSGLPALVNAGYNGSSFPIVVQVQGDGAEVEKAIRACGVEAVHRIGDARELERFGDVAGTTVLLFKGLL